MWSVFICLWLSVSNLLPTLFFSQPAVETWWKDHQNGLWATDPKPAEEGLWDVFLQSPRTHFRPHRSEADFKCHWERTDGKYPEGRTPGGAGQGSIGWVTVEIQRLHPNP